jgi:hypothetical protein
MEKSESKLEIANEKKVDVRLAEYKLHHDSYFSARGQYLTFVTIALLALGTFDAAILNVEKPPSGPAKALMMSIVFLLLLCTLIAQLIGIRSTKQVGNRIKKLGGELGIEPFDPTWPLKIAIWTTLTVNIVLIIVHMIVFIRL